MSAATQSIPAAKAKIAVIDDDRFIRYLLDLHLRKAGYEVFTAEDAVVLCLGQDEPAAAVRRDGRRLLAGAARVREQLVCPRLPLCFLPSAVCFLPSVHRSLLSLSAESAVYCCTLSFNA